MIALRNWQQAKREATIEAVQKAIDSLLISGSEITFSAVAQEAQIARKTLYAVAELKSLVLAHRADQDDTTKLTAKIAELESENKKLRDALFAIKTVIYG